MALRSLENSAPTMVVPMPCTAWLLSEASKICLLASLMPVIKRFSAMERCGSKWNGQVASSLCVARKKEATVWVAMRLATSPALCPPIPSATTNRSNSGRMQKLSSLCSRWSPTSDRPAATMCMDSRSGPELPPKVHGFRETVKLLAPKLTPGRALVAFQNPRRRFLAVCSLILAASCSADRSTVEGALAAAASAVGARDHEALLQALDE